MSSPLEEAIKNNDVNTVQELLDKDADQKFINGAWWSEIHLHAVMDERHAEIIKLLLQHGLKVTVSLMEHLPFIQPTQCLKDLLAFILKYTKDIYCLRDAFTALVYSTHQGQDTLDMFGMILDHGLPINKLVYDNINEVYRPLHLSIMRHRMDLLLMLIERGASLRRRTFIGRTPLFLTAQFPNFLAMKLLLKKGVNINKQNYDGTTALHMAGQYQEFSEAGKEKEILCLLLENGADLNIKSLLSTESEKTPLTFGEMSTGKFLLVKQLAKLKFEGQPICDENLDYMKRLDVLQKKFDSCLSELQKMQDCKFYKGYSLYDVYEMGKKHKKLTLMMKNQNFVEAFECSINDVVLEHFKEDLNNIFKKALKRKNDFHFEEEKLKSIFRDCLPDLAIRQISYFASGHLFINQYKRTRESDSESEYEPDEEYEGSDLDEDDFGDNDLGIDENDDDDFDGGDFEYFGD